MSAAHARAAIALDLVETKATQGAGEPGRFGEIEWAPDTVVKVVGDTSAEKDTMRLP